MALSRSSSASKSEWGGCGEQTHNQQEGSETLEDATEISGPYVMAEEEKAKYHQQYKAPSLSSHYIPTMPGMNDFKEVSGIRRTRNEARLKMFYKSKNVSIYPSRSTQTSSGSVGDAPGGSQVSMDSGSRCTLSATRNIVYPPSSSGKRDCSSKFDMFEDSDNILNEEELDPMMPSYVTYREKLCTAVGDHDNQLLRNSMWVAVSEDNRYNICCTSSSALECHLGGKAQVEGSSRPISGNSSEDAATTNLFGGAAAYLPTFGEVQLPCFVYHSSVQVKNKVYLLGGLIPSFEHDDVAPNLDDFHVDGIKNLPPPILDELVNNPSMIPNKHLYVYSTNGLTVKRPKPTGQLPPPLLCASLSKVTDRYVFYYGGFEIRHDTIVDEESGQYYVRRRAFINSSAYILDTHIFKFMKVELVVQPTKFSSYKPTVSRFGHMQVSLKWSVPSGVSRFTDSEDGKSASSSIKTGTPSCSSSAEDCSTHGISSEFTASRMSGMANSHVYTILIMGGYKQTHGNRFQALNDFWRLDVTVISRGKKGYFKFAETALATSISKNCDVDGLWPEARGFMSACISDTTSLSTDSLLANLLEDIKFRSQQDLPREEAPTQPVFSNIPFGHRKQKQSPNQDSDKSAKTTITQDNINKTLVIHGGSNDGHVYGDMWWFDFDDEKWLQVPFFACDAHSREKFKASLPAVGHSLIQLCDRFLFFGGLNQQDVDRIYGSHIQHTSSDGTLLCSMDGSTGILELSTMTVKCLTYTKNNNTFLFRRHLKLIATAAHFVRGHVWLIGGATVLSFPSSFQGNIKNLQLCGAATELVVPLAEEDIL